MSAFSGSALRRAGRVAAGCAAFLVAPSIAAAPGTHAPPVSTWDTRASSIVLAYRIGLLPGHFHVVSYNASFAAMSGKMAAQFGIHYLNFAEEEADPTSHGVSGTGAAVFSLPVGERFDNGIPKLAVGLYVGAAPTAFISGQRSKLSLPAVLGFGLPWSPSVAATLTPWFEASPGANIDTVVEPFDVEELTPEERQAFADPSTGEIDSSVVDKIAGRSLETELSMSVGMRAGLDVAVHLSDSVDIRLTGQIGSLGSAFQGTAVGHVGGAFVVRWDDIVPAILPPERRLAGEDCEDIEARFRMCPAYRRMLQQPGRPRRPAPAPAPRQRSPRSAPRAQPPAAPSRRPQGQPEQPAAPKQPPAEQPPTERPKKPPTGSFEPVE